jgi:hypothetical protein
MCLNVQAMRAWATDGFYFSHVVKEWWNNGKLEDRNHPAQESFSRQILFV